MKLKEITLTLEQTTKSSSVLLLGVTTIKRYEDGKITDDVEGYRYTVVCPSNKFEKMTVKIKEKNPSITEEEIEANGGTISVTFINFEGKFYQDKNKNVCFYATADGVKVIE